MSALPGDGDNLESGEWGVFVARVVKEIREEVGETAAHIAARSLHEQKRDAIEVMREQEAAAQDLLQRAMTEVKDARDAHSRLQADLARLEAAVRSATSEAGEIRTAAHDAATRHRAEVDAWAEEESRRIATARGDLNAAEVDLAARRSAMLDLDEALAKRREALAQRESELSQLEAEATADREKVSRLAAEVRSRGEAVECELARGREEAERQRDAARTLAEETDALREQAATAMADAAGVRAEALALREEAEATLRHAESVHFVATRAVDAAPAEPVIDVRHGDLSEQQRDLDEQQAELDERDRQLEAWEAELTARAAVLENRPELDPAPPSRRTQQRNHPSRSASGWGRRPPPEG